MQFRFDGFSVWTSGDTILTNRCAKKVKLFRAVFFELPTGDSTISSENTGIFRQMRHGNAINRLSENLTFFAQRSVILRS